MSSLLQLAVAPATGTATAAEEPAAWIVVVMGMLIVFFGLICLIFLCKIMGAVMRLFEKKPTATAASGVSAAPAVSAASATAIPDRPAFVAAVAAAIAEEEGVSVSAIRICSIKKL